VCSTKDAKADAGEKCFYVRCRYVPSNVLTTSAGQLSAVSVGCFTPKWLAKVLKKNTLHSTPNFTYKNL
jgi:hypothetical protein